MKNKESQDTRLDLWLWAARFFKTRSLAKTAIDGGKIRLNGNKTKPSKFVSLGDEIKISQSTSQISVIVNALSSRRESASIAQGLYRETDESVELREKIVAQRKMERAGLKIPNRRPGKHDRQALRDLKKNSSLPSEDSF